MRLRAPPAALDPPFEQRLTRKYSESDKEDYCSKSNSETNIRDTFQAELQKNQSLQNLRQTRLTRTADSDEDVNYKRVPYKRYEPNGNYPDSDEDMDVTPAQNYVNTVKLENGVDSSDHDANDNPVYYKKEKQTEVELPNLDSISLKSKPSKTGKMRRTKKRTVK